MILRWFPIRRHIIIVMIGLPGNGQYAHYHHADKAADKYAANKSYHNIIPFKSRSLTDDLVASLSHSRAGDQGEQIFSFYDINIVCFGCGNLFL